MFVSAVSLHCCVTTVNSDQPEQVRKQASVFPFERVSLVEHQKQSAADSFRNYADSCEEWLAVIIFPRLHFIVWLTSMCSLGLHLAAEDSTMKWRNMAHACLWSFPVWPSVNAVIFICFPDMGVDSYQVLGNFYVLQVTWKICTKGWRLQSKVVVHRPGAYNNFSPSLPQHGHHFFPPRLVTWHIHSWGPLHRGGACLTGAVGASATPCSGDILPSRAGAPAAETKNSCQGNAEFRSSMARSALSGFPLTFLLTYCCSSLKFTFCLQQVLQVPVGSGFAFVWECCQVTNMPLMVLIASGEVIVSI